MSFPHCFFSVGYYKLNSTGFKNRGEDRNTAGLIQIKTGDLQLPPPCSTPYGFFQELDREETLLFKNIFLILYKCTCCLPTFPLRQKVREYNGQWTANTFNFLFDVHLPILPHRNYFRLGKSHKPVPIQRNVEKLNSPDSSKQMEKGVQFTLSTNLFSESSCF